MKPLIALALLFPATLAAQDARDTVFSKRFRVECDSLATWRVGQQPLWYKRQIAGCRANSDSLRMTRVITPPPPPPNQAPVARASGSCVALTKICSVDGSASTDDKAIASARITWGDGSFTSALTGSHTFAAAGTYNGALTVTDAEGLSNSAPISLVIAAATQDSVIVADSTVSIAVQPELPRSVPAPVFAKATRVVQVTSDLQGALDRAQPGDSLVLTGTFTGNFVLPARQCGAGISVTSAGVLPTGRMTPTKAAPLAKLVTNNSTAALKTINPTCGWRLAGLEIAASASAGVPGTSLNYGILWIGDGGWLGGGETVRSVATQPRDIILDRLYLHGAPTTNTTRCLYLNAGAAIVRDSWISDCHAVGSDAQAILLCNGTGPTLIENNVLQGSGENFLAGGCDPVDATLIPSDITFRRNHVSKLLSWKGVWTVKNLFELKNARRVLVEANVLEQTWQAAQNGMAIVIKSSTETCSACTFEGSKDVTLRYNVIREAHIGLNLQAIDGSSAGTTASHTERIAVTDNLFSGIGTANGIAPQQGHLMLLTHDLKDILIARNTFVSNTPGYGLAVYLAYAAGGMQRIDIRDNILAGQSYYAIASDCGGLHAAAFTCSAGTAWRFAGNVVSQVNQEFWAASPSGNTYVDAISKLGLTSAFTSTLFPKVGADILAINAKTSGVVIAAP